MSLILSVSGLQFYLLFLGHEFGMNTYLFRSFGYLREISYFIGFPESLRNFSQPCWVIIDIVVSLSQKNYAFEALVLKILRSFNFYHSVLSPMLDARVRSSGLCHSIFVSILILRNSHWLSLGFVMLLWCGELQNLLEFGLIVWHVGNDLVVLDMGFKALCLFIFQVLLVEFILVFILSVHLQLFSCLLEREWFIQGVVEVTLGIKGFTLLPMTIFISFLCCTYGGEKGNLVIGAERDRGMAYHSDSKLWGRLWNGFLTLVGSGKGGSILWIL